MPLIRIAHQGAHPFSLGTISSIGMALAEYGLPYPACKCTPDVMI